MAVSDKRVVVAVLSPLAYILVVSPLARRLFDERDIGIGLIALA